MLLTVCVRDDTLPSSVVILLCSAVAVCCSDETSPSAFVMRDKIVCVYAGDLDTNALARALRTALPKYMLPNVYEKLEALPHNANGKLDRAALKERFLHAQS